MTNTRLLSAAGIGPVRFGERPSTAVGELRSLLGDSKVVRDDCALAVEFDALTVTFHPYDARAFEPSARVFNAFYTRSALLATDRGVRVGSTLSALRAAYPEVDQRVDTRLPSEATSLYVHGAGGVLVFELRVEPGGSEPVIWSISGAFGAETAACGD